MARLTAGLVSALVVLIVLGVGVTPGNGQLVGNPCGGLNGAPPRAYFAEFPKKRIVSSKSRDLSLAASDDGTVVVAKTNPNDQKQAWIQDDRAIGNLATEVGCRKPFALVNLDQNTLLAIVPPSRNPTDPAVLAAYNPCSCVRPSMLWTQGTPNADGFYTIQMFRNESRAFNILKGAFVNNKLGVRPTDGVSDNVLFKIVRF